MQAGTVRGGESGFWHDHGDEISAAITENGVSRSTKTRLQVVRRLVFVIILAIGIALALGQFGSIRRLATAILASGALVGLIVGFAARQTIANMVAGLMARSRSRCGSATG